MRRAMLAVLAVAASLLGIAPQAHADGLHLVSCAYEQSWMPACAEPWVFMAPTVTYRVKAGDTLWRIAVKAYGSEHGGHRWHDIATLNHISGTHIQTGQTLRIPRAFFDPSHPGRMTSAGPRR